MIPIKNERIDFITEKSNVDNNDYFKVSKNDKIKSKSQKRMLRKKMLFEE